MAGFEVVLVEAEGLALELRDPVDALGADFAGSSAAADFEVFDIFEDRDVLASCSAED